MYHVTSNKVSNESFSRYVSKTCARFPLLLSGHIQHPLLIPPSELCLLAQATYPPPTLLCLPALYCYTTTVCVLSLLLGSILPPSRKPSGALAWFEALKCYLCLYWAWDETRSRTQFVGHRDTSCNIIGKGYIRTDRGTDMWTKSVSSCPCDL